MSWGHISRIPLLNYRFGWPRLVGHYGHHKIAYDGWMILSERSAEYHRKSHQTTKKGRRFLIPKREEILHQLSFGRLFEVDPTWSHYFRRASFHPLLGYSLWNVWNSSTLTMVDKFIKSRPLGFLKIPIQHAQFITLPKYLWVFMSRNPRLNDREDFDLLSVVASETIGSSVTETPSWPQFLGHLNLMVQGLQRADSLSHFGPCNTSF